MWYVLPAKGNSAIYLGWKQQMNASLIHAAIADGTLAEYLREYKVHEGDVAYIPAGTVHAMRRDTIVAEIQENSDLTYRLYDYNRVGNDGKKRPLKLDKAMQVMDFSPENEASCTSTMPRIDGVVNLKKTPYFTTNLLSPTKPVQRDYMLLDSFVAYMCVEGQCTVIALDGEAEDNSVSMRLGEAVLIPAALNDILISPKGHCKLLEVYIEL